MYTGSDSNLIVSNDSSWVAYMAHGTRTSSSRHFRNLTLPGPLNGVSTFSTSLETTTSHGASICTNCKTHQACKHT